MSRPSDIAIAPRPVIGRQDFFVVGDGQSAGIPFVENFRADDGDRIWIAAGDLMARRLANLVADPAKRAAALESLGSRYGALAIAGLAPELLEEFIAAEIAATTPLAPFAITELNTYGGFIFDVNGRVFLDLRTYADGRLVANPDITPNNDEPSTGTDSRGVFVFPDTLLAASDRNGDGVVDFKDGL
ncbi:MAG: hypothetical protein ACKOTB_03395, partial [Planctomycetia bacterium]